MEFKGTKGEWKAVLSGSLSSVRCEGVKNNLASMINSKSYYSEDLREQRESWLAFRKRTEPLRDKQNEECEANAKLIAAAPELLEACITVLDSLNGAEYAIPCADIVEKAINKALGQ